MSKLNKIEQQKMFRLALMLRSLHDQAKDPSQPLEVRQSASQDLANTVNSHFDLIVAGLRIAGGAERV